MDRLPERKAIGADTDASASPLSPLSDDVEVTAFTAQAALPPVTQSPTPHTTAVFDSEEDDDDDNGEGCEDNMNSIAYNETVSPPTSALASGTPAAASASAAVQYDVHDHTMASPADAKLKRRVWVLPRDLLPSSVTSSSFLQKSPNATLSSSSSARADAHSSTHASPSSHLYRIGREEGGCSTRTSTQSASAAGGAGGTEENSHLHSTHISDDPSQLASPASFHSSFEGRSSTGAAAAAATPSSLRVSGYGSTPPEALRVPAHTVRLPHPRHGHPTLYLVRPTYACASVPRAPPRLLPASSSSSSLLYEVQAQSPSNDFAQSWFVGEKEEVIPSRPHNGELLVVTPVDLTYFALRELLGDAAVYARLSHRFMSAADLYRNGEACDTSAPASPPRASASAEAPSREAIESFVSVFGGVSSGGGGEDDHHSSQSSDSSPFSLHYSNKSSLQFSPHPSEGKLTQGASPPRMTGDASTAGASASPAVKRGWSGWANAAAQYPLTFHACLTALQSDTVLRRLCEVREVASGPNDDNNKGSGGGDLVSTEVYYRPSETVAVAWLKTKVLQLRASAALRAVLQLPEPTPPSSALPSAEGNGTNAPASSSVALSTQRTPTTEDMDKSSHSADANAGAEVPMSIAFGMVAEYVPERLHRLLAVACGLPDPSAAPSSQTPSTGNTASATSTTAMTGGASSISANAKRSREGEGLSGNAEATAVPTGPKSASVKRLEKAGRPKGTPTLFSMFAKKKKEDEK